MTDEERVGQSGMSWTDENFLKIHQIVCANQWLTMRDPQQIKGNCVENFKWRPRQTVKQIYYLKVLHRLDEKVRHK